MELLNKVLDLVQDRGPLNRMLELVQDKVLLSRMLELVLGELLGQGRQRVAMETLRENRVVKQLESVRDVLKNEIEEDREVNQEPDVLKNEIEDDTELIGESIPVTTSRRTVFFCTRWL